MSTTAHPLGLRVLAHALGAITVGSIAVTLVAGIVEGDSVIQDLPFVVLLTVTLLVGWLLTIRLPRHPVGWILLAVPALFTTSAPPEPPRARAGDVVSGRLAVDRLVQRHRRGPLVGVVPTRVAPAVAAAAPVPDRPAALAALALVLLADDRRPDRGLLFLGTGDPFVDEHDITRNPAFIPAIHDLAPQFFVVIIATAACFVASIASLFVRYRNALARERAQLRWMMWAVALAVAGLVAGNIVPSGGEWVQTVGLLLYALVPIAVAVAVLRYRLYEIDRIISRTAAYAVVTAVVIGTYALVVLLISLLLPGLQRAPIGVALATLAAAAMFLPALRWVRRGIDRVFNRAQYDAERVVIAFGERIRNGADPHTAGVDLLGAVRQTLQPTAIGLWTRGDSR